MAASEANANLAGLMLIGSKVRIIRRHDSNTIPPQS